VEPLKQHYRSLNQQNNNNEFTRQSLRAGDVRISFKLEINSAIKYIFIFL
jgi:hypothetical protein